MILSEWSSAEVTSVIAVISSAFMSALALTVTKIIDARTRSRLAIIEAESKAARELAAHNQGKSEQLASQVAGIQKQVTAALLATPAPTPVSIEETLKKMEAHGDGD